MKILVVSAHFGVGHVSHLKAYVSLATQCGYNVALYIDERYRPFLNEVDSPILTNKSQIKAYMPDVILIYNIGTENIGIIKMGKRMGCKIAYVLHEPYCGIKLLMKEGDIHHISKMAAAYLANAYICRKVDKVLLCSEEAISHCKKYMKAAYKKSAFFPLILPDNFEREGKREYFSMIGGFCEAHGSGEFLSFAKKCYKKSRICFQIFTRSDISAYLNDDILQAMIKQKQLVVQQGRPLTEQEINGAYRNSICVWNGYKKSTQSGVLANSFMQGTPVIATRTGSFEEYIAEGETGVFIDNYAYETIVSAYEKICKNIDRMEKSCRETFLQKNFFGGQAERFMEIVASM